MRKGTTPDAEVPQFRQDIQTLLKARVREAIEAALDEEVQLALGAGRYERAGGRRGYRNGSEPRQVTTPDGTRELEVPRGRLFDEGGKSREFESELLPLYQRRMKAVDDAILATYLGGANTRRIRKALERGTPRAGHSVLFRTASELIEDLQVDSPELRRRQLAQYGRPSLLCIDIEGRSYRVRESEQEAAARRQKR